MAMSSLYWDEKIECMPPEQLKALQEERLAATVQRCYTTPFYKEVFSEAGISPEDIRTLDDLKSIPFTTKDMFRERQAKFPPFGDYTAVPLTEIAHIGVTSGSSGAPTKILYTRQDMERLAERSARALWMMGVRPSDRVMVSFTYQLFLGAWYVHYGLERLGAAIIPFGTGNTLRQIEMMRELGATVWMATPSYVIYTAEVASTAGIDLRDLNLRIVCTTGEPGASIPSFRRKLEEISGAKITDWPGQSEALGYLCHCQWQICHSFEDYFIYEVVDPETGSDVGPGQHGVLVLTSLLQETQPVLRWWTGDITLYEEKQCECGRTGRIYPQGILGRADDMLKVRGVRVWPSAIGELLQQVDGTTGEFRIVLDDDNVLETGVLLKLRLLVERAEGVEPHIAREKVEQAMKSRFNITPEIEVLDPQSLERFEHKTIRILDRRS